jgi:hypothetical protein
MATATSTTPTPQAAAILVHQDLAINLLSNRARKKRSRKELESALKSNHAELLSQQNVIDHQEKKIDLLNRRNRDLASPVKKKDEGAWLVAWLLAWIGWGCDWELLLVVWYYM